MEEHEKRVIDKMLKIKPSKILQIGVQLAMNDEDNSLNEKKGGFQRAIFVSQFSPLCGHFLLCRKEVGDTGQIKKKLLMVWNRRKLS